MQGRKWTGKTTPQGLLWSSEATKGGCCYSSDSHGFSPDLGVHWKAEWEQKEIQLFPEGRNGGFGWPDRPQNKGQAKGTELFFPCSCASHGMAEADPQTGHFN